MKYLGVFLLGLLVAGWIQSIRWNSDVTKKELDWAEAQALAVSEVNGKLVKAEDMAEEDRRQYIKKVASNEERIRQLENNVNKPNPPQRLYVSAKCPTGLLTPGTVPSGTGPGTAELNASARPAYFALARGIAKQYEDLQFCRKKLLERSRDNGR